MAESSNRAVISLWKRSAFTPAHKGALARVRPDEMAAQVLKALLTEANLPSEAIEDVMVGCAFPEGEQGMNIGRIIGLMAGLPDSVAGVTINRFCGSSMQAIHLAAGMIACGAGELFVCGGVESMTRIPMGGYNPLPHPGLYGERPGVYMSMGLTAENGAKACNVARPAQEAFALESQRRAAAARENLAKEIAPITLPKGGVVAEDGCLRPDSTAEGLAGLAPAFLANGTVTAATSSPLTDGACFVIVASEAAAKKYKLPVYARILSMAVAGCAPETMGLGPIAASEKALKRAGITAADVDVAEINEAFAAQAIPCVAQIGVPAERVNLEGGAIAIGHPLGATGARITAKAAQLLHQRKGRYALASQCIGGGQGIATVLEAL
jgi:acetyl-CoA acyltransferase